MTIDISKNLSELSRRLDLPSGIALLREIAKDPIVERRGEENWAEMENSNFYKMINGEK